MDIKFRLSFAGREKSCGRGRTPDICMGVCRIFSKFLDDVIKNEIVVGFEFPVLHFIACPVNFFIFVFAKVG